MVEAYYARATRAGLRYIRAVPARRSSFVLAALTLASSGCGSAARTRPAAPAQGMLAAIVRAADTGAAVSDATIVLRRPGQPTPVAEQLDRTGMYLIALPPGRYQVDVYRHTEFVGEQEVTIVAGKVSGLDFAVGAALAPAQPIVVGAGTAPLWRFRPLDGDPRTGVIEGTVTEQRDQTRLAGAVVTVVDNRGRLIADAVSDDQGRYRLAGIAPGTYVVTTYYTLVGRGQFEIRRGDVEVSGGDVVVVPLEIETDHS